MTVGVNYGYDAFVAAQSGIRTNLEQAIENPSGDLTQQVTNQIIGQNGVAANVQSIKTEDSVFQTLLDIKA